MMAMEKHPDSIKIATAWIILVIVKQHLVKSVEQMDLSSMYHKYTPRLAGCCHPSRALRALVYVHRGTSLLGKRPPHRTPIGP